MFKCTVDNPQLQECERATGAVRRLVHGGQQQGIKLGKSILQLANDKPRIP